NFMRAYRNLYHPVDHVLGVYFHQCALSMSCEQLSRAGLFLAARGSNPTTGHSVVSPKTDQPVRAASISRAAAPSCELP
ncbi:glutaminase, partial [Rhizobium ruizarguesonis]